VVIAISVAPASSHDGEASAAGTTGATGAAAASSEPTDAAAPASPAPAPAAAAGSSTTTTTPTPATPAAERPNEAKPRATEPLRFLVRAQLAGDAGLLPAAAVGGGLAVGLVIVRDLGIEASANVFGSQDGTIGGTPERGASFGLLSAGARACWTLTHGIEVAPCLGVEIARISASGFGAAQVSDAAAVTWGPEALLAGRIPVTGPISVRVGIGGFAPISRQSFVINAAGTVHQPAVVALRTFAGPEVRF
jgi:hypothetical protein